MKYELGQLVKVKASSFHTFSEGTIVKVLDGGTKEYFCGDINDVSHVQFLIESEMEPYQGEGSERSIATKA